MADSEFEEFRNCFEVLPQHLKAPAHTYTLVHDVGLDEESPTSPEASVKRGERVEGRSGGGPIPLSASDDYLPLPPPNPSSSAGPGPTPPLSRDWHDRPVGGERRRRKLPEIPKHKKPGSVLSLADELGAALSRQPPPPSLLMLKCHRYLRDDADTSPDSDHFQGTDVDSGHSTAHSPTQRTDSDTGSPTSSSMTGMELLEATHRALHRFVPRHRDELELDIGDPIYVHKEAEDLWCEGVNLRTGRQGVFPSAYVVDMEYNDFDPNTPKVKRERFLLGYLGSVETTSHKGNSVLAQAVRKIQVTCHKPHSCILEVSDQGLRMVDKSKSKGSSGPCHDYFYSLKNVSFCAFHAADHRYLGFITRHPTLTRFACHVFLGRDSTRPVAEAIGRAFERFYTKFIETAYPIEDIYIE